jgi:hypothetical protein
MHAIPTFEIPKPKRPVSPESLLNVPLMRQALLDPQSRVVVRAIDERWFQEEKISFSMQGFNPLSGQIFVPGQSLLALWLKNPFESCRPHNFQDRLAKKALFTICHDYLHCWAYSAINELMPEIGLGTTRITRDNLDDLAFCHLLTEAVATIGLDYWYMSTIDLNDVVDLSTHIGPFTTSYHERHLKHFRKIIPDFKVQDPSFFTVLAAFYSNSVLFGFRAGDEDRLEEIRHNPLAWMWFKKELGYGELQRKYSRLWLAYLSDEDIQISEELLAAPVSADADWKKKLIADVGQLLWQKIKHDKLHRFSRSLDEDKVWRAPKSKKIDCRLINFNALTEAEIEELTERAERGELSEKAVLHGATQFDFLFFQYVSIFNYDQFDPQLMKLFGNLRKQQDFRLTRKLFKDQPRVEVTDQEPRDLFLLN